MNYDHAFHAGNFADVLKHASLCLCLQSLLEKDKPFFVLDTHAGQGRFDLDSSAAARTGEAESGVKRLLSGDAVTLEGGSAAMPEGGSADMLEGGSAAMPESLSAYLDAVRALGWAGDRLRAYPGSPWLANYFLRPKDRLILIEKHPVHQRALKALMGARPNTRIEAGDGYAALKALLPPPERRGLVLIDPPFEDRAEFEALAKAVRRSLRRWASGRYLIWFPLKDESAVAAFLSETQGLIDVPALFARLRVAAPKADGKGMVETGLLALNPPYRLQTALPEMLPFLAETLKQDAAARWSLETLDPAR